jgi:hypothetical protein
MTNEKYQNAEWKMPPLATGHFSNNQALPLWWSVPDKQVTMRVA